MWIKRSDVIRVVYRESDIRIETPYRDFDIEPCSDETLGDLYAEVCAFVFDGKEMYA